MSVLLTVNIVSHKLTQPSTEQFW